MILIAGIGNIFFGDDGFGCEVARVLALDPPAGAKVEDFGIRGLHLAYELLAAYEHAVLIDAVPRGETPGTLYVIEPSEAPRPARPTRTAWTWVRCSARCARSAASRRRSRSWAASRRASTRRSACPNRWRRPSAPRARSCGA